MAKRRKTHTRRRHSRRSSMHGTKGMAGNIIAIAGGAIAAKFIIKSLAGKLNDKMLNGAVLAAGIFLPKFVKSDFGKGLGAGMIAAGSVGLINSFGVLNGLGEIGEGDGYQMEFISGDGGTDRLSVISEADGDYNMENDYSNTFAMAGSGDISVLSGVEDGEEDTYSQFAPGLI